MNQRAAPPSVGDVLAQSRALNQPGRVSWQLWHQIVGSRVAARSRPDRIENGTLCIVVTSNAWAQEMSLLQRTVLARLKHHGVQVERLWFRVGKVTPLRRPKSVRQVDPAPLPTELVQRLQHIDDEELRLAISEAASLGLGRLANEAE